MIRIFRLVGPAALLVVSAALHGCKSGPPPPPKPMIATIAVKVSGEANPDAQNRASPVVVRVYKLKDDDAFKSADFFALVDKEQATLAASLVSREEMVLSPGDQQSATAELPVDTRFIGVVAEYRDIRNAAWRAEAPIPVKTPKKKGKPATVNVAIAVERASVSVSAQ